MKRGLIALFVVMVLMFNVTGVSAAIAPTLGQQGNEYSIDSSTDTVQGAGITSSTPLEDSSTIRPTPNLDEDIEIDMVSPWKNIWDNALTFVSPNVYFLIKKFANDLRGTSAASIRG